MCPPGSRIEGLDLSLKFRKSRFVERDIRFCEENAFLDSGCLRAKVPDSVCKESKQEGEERAREEYLTESPVILRDDLNLEIDED
jgi:hypothetical protein